MNRLCEFIGSSSGLAPMRQGLGLGWVISALAGLVVLFGIEDAEADTKCSYTWTACSPSSDCALVEPQETYRYCTYGLDNRCRFYIVDCWYSSTPCSEVEQPTEIAGPTDGCFNQETECSYFDDCAELNSALPYRYCTTYYDARGDIYWQGSCKCSSTPCSESEQDQMTAVLTPAIAGRPAQHRLGASYPNPFNPQMIIPLDLATDEERVHLALYDVLGHRVRQLWDGPLGAGRHRFVWNGRDEAGKAVAAGVYIYKVEVDGQIEARKTTKLP